MITIFDDVYVCVLNLLSIIFIQTYIIIIIMILNLTKFLM